MLLMAVPVNTIEKNLQCPPNTWRDLPESLQGVCNLVADTENYIGRLAKSCYRTSGWLRYG